MAYYIYIVRCSDNSYYVGYSENVAKRVKAHNKGSGLHYTKTRRPVVLVYQEEYESKKIALHRERQIKQWRRAKKEALINGDLARLKELSKSQANG